MLSDDKILIPFPYLNASNKLPNIVLVVLIDIATLKKKNSMCVCCKYNVLMLELNVFGL